MNATITPDKPKPYLGREVAIEKVFQVKGTFESMYAAERWAIANGYDYGSTCAMMPTALTKGDYAATDLPHKWKNFTPKQRNNVAGAMTGDMREGPVYVRIFA